MAADETVSSALDNLLEEYANAFILKASARIGLPVETMKRILFDGTQGRAPVAEGSLHHSHAITRDAIVPGCCYCARFGNAMAHTKTT